MEARSKRHGKKQICEIKEAKGLKKLRRLAFIQSDMRLAWKRPEMNMLNRKKKQY